MFNVLNHVNFAPPNPFDTGSVFGQDGSISNNGGLNRTVTEQRDIQFALKLIW
jgi:hypothetical protein